MSEETELTEDDLVELSLLRDFEIDELINAGFLSESEQLTAPLDEEVTFKNEELDLHVTAGPFYPAVSATWRLDNYTLSRTAVDGLRMQLRQIVEDSRVTNNISRWRKRGEECELGVFDPKMTVLELAKETAAHLKSWREKLKEAPKKKRKDADKEDIHFSEKPTSSIMTSSDIAFHYLQKTPQQICSQIPPSYRVLHVEEILRPDLARNFHQKQAEMREKLSTYSLNALRGWVPADMQHIGRKEVFVDHLVKPWVTFHGTARQFVPSIVRYGFFQPGQRNPGTNEAHGVRCGSTYGRGIYSSPNPDFSLSYTGNACHATKPNEYFGIKLLVCATLMGRTANVYREHNWREQTKPYPGADSHVSNRGLECVVFDTAQILPVYVIHIDWGHDNYQHFMDLPGDPGNFVPTQKKTHAKLLQDVRWPGDVQRQRAAVFSRAAKWFPYGFGPSTGSKFVVEEIGDVDEDEEEYGDYQALRGEEIKDKMNLDFWSWVKVGEEMDAAARGDGALDEYTLQRQWYGPEALKATSAWDEIPDPRENEEKDNDFEDDDDLCIGQLMV